MAKYVTTTDLATQSRKVLKFLNEEKIMIVLRHHKPVAFLISIDKVDDENLDWILELRKERENWTTRI